MTQAPHTEHHHEHQAEHHEAETEEKHDEIAELKAEILQSLEKKENKSPLPLGSWLVTIVLAVLTLLAVIQTVQSAILLNKIKSGQVNLGGTANTSLQDAPDMVGGC